MPEIPRILIEASGSIGATGLRVQPVHRVCGAGRPNTLPFVTPKRPSIPSRLDRTFVACCHFDASAVEPRAALVLSRNQQFVTEPFSQLEIRPRQDHLTERFGQNSNSPPTLRPNRSVGPTTRQSR